MSLFLLTYLCVYGALHVYGFYKAHQAFAFDNGVKILLCALMALMVLAPIITRSAEHAQLHALAHVSARAGFIWMGFIFIFFSLFLSTDIVLFLIQVLKKISGLNSLPTLPGARTLFLFILGFTICISAWGCMQARNIRTEHVRLSSTKLPPDIKNLRIVQISDVHLGLIIREKRLNEIIDAIKAAQPDIVVSTGDLVDGQISQLNGLSKLLADIQPRYGKFAITGNHEYYAGIQQSLKFTTASGFNLLKGEAHSIPDLINIVGMDDPAGKHFGEYSSPDEELLLKNLPERFTLLLRHQPHIRQNTLGLFDLQLSGHTHKGQIFPFTLLVKAFFPRDAGFYELGEKSSLYVSRGTGTWGPPMRVLSPPEICIIDIQNINARH